MTVATAPTREVFFGDASTTAFSTSFKAIASTDVQVTVDDVVQALTTDYTLTNLNTDTGFTVTFVSAPASGAVVVIRLNMPIPYQPTDFAAGGLIPAETLEDTLDRLALQIGQLTTGASVGIGILPGSTTIQEFTATAGQTVFSLSSSYVTGANQLAVYVNGVRQVPTAFTETNTTSFTLSAGAELNDLVMAEIHPHGNLSGKVTTTDATETTAQSFTLADNAAYLVTAEVIGMESDGSDRVGYRIQGLFYRDGGGATLQGALSSQFSVESDTDWACTLDTNSNDVRVRVTGEAATTIRWTAHLSFLQQD